MMTRIKALINHESPLVFGQRKTRSLRYGFLCEGQVPGYVNLIAGAAVRPNAIQALP